MSTSNEKSTTNVSSDKITAAINMVTLASTNTNRTQNEQASTSTQPTTDSTGKQLLVETSPPESTKKESVPSSTQRTPKETNELSPESTSAKPTTAPSNNEPHAVGNKEVLVPEKSEVEVLEVKCSRIFGKATESRRSCPNMAVVSTLKRKSPYCDSCTRELREIDRQRKKLKRLKEKEQKKKQENAPPKMLQLVQEEKVQDLITDSGSVKVLIPSLALLSQIVGLRFVFHHDMSSISRDESWFTVIDCLARQQRSTKQKFLARYLPFGCGAREWKQDMGQWANSHQLCVVERLLKEIKEILPNKNQMHHSTVTLYVTENQKVAVPYKIKDVSHENKVNIGWSFHLPLCKEGLHLFLWDAEVTRTQKVHIPFGCAFLTRGDVPISGNAGSFGNMRLTGTFTNTKLNYDDQDFRQYMVEPKKWKSFVAGNEWLKGASVNKHPAVEVLKCETLQKEVVQKPILLKQHYALPDDFNENLKK